MSQRRSVTCFPKKETAMRGEDQGWAEGHMSLSLRSLADQTPADNQVSLIFSSTCQTLSETAAEEMQLKSSTRQAELFFLSLFPEDSICNFKLMQSGNDATGSADMKQFYRNWKIKAVVSLCVQIIQQISRLLPKLATESWQSCGQWAVYSEYPQNEETRCRQVYNQRRRCAVTSEG